MTIKKCAIIATVILVPSIAEAKSNRGLAKLMAPVLASETYCGLEYNQSAIVDWIDRNSIPGDLNFIKQLSARTNLEDVLTRQKSGGILTAHCRAIKRAAEHYGLMK